MTSPSFSYFALSEGNLEDVLVESRIDLAVKILRVTCGLVSGLLASRVVVLGMVVLGMVVLEVVVGVRCREVRCSATACI
jgi:hypothetical protein